MSRRRNANRTRLPPTARQARRRGILSAVFGMIRDKEHEAAGRQLAEYLAHDPHDPSALLLSAMLAFDVGKQVVRVKDDDGHWIDPIETAEEFADMALAASPDDDWPDLFWVRAMVLSRRGRHLEAKTSMERCLELAPQRGLFYVDYGGILAALGRYQEALDVWERAPVSGDERLAMEFNRAHLLLVLGRYEEGFRAAEVRHRSASYRRDVGRPFMDDSPQLAWQGQPIPGERLLVYAEQGLGDSLLLWRYLPWVRDTSQATIILETLGPLVALAHHLPDHARPDVIVQQDDPLPIFDRHVGIFSLPFLAGTTLETVPAVL